MRDGSSCDSSTMEAVIDFERTSESLTKVAGICVSTGLSTNDNEFLVETGDIPVSSQRASRLEILSRITEVKLK